MKSTRLVVVLHLLALLPLFTWRKPTPPIKPHVAVHTVQLVEKPKPVPKPPTPPVAVAKPTPKPKPKPQPKTPSKPAQNAQQNSELLAMMEKSLAQLEGGSTSIPLAKIGTLKSESTYQEMLVNYLQELLHFPEDGEVRVKLTVARNGTITQSVILKSSSTRNASYITHNLEGLSLPPFGTHFKGESRHTFSVTLTSR